MAKKYLYQIGHGAEGDTYGTIELTKAEAKIVAYALDESNWKELHEESYSGAFYIDTDHPMEIK